MERARVTVGITATLLAGFPGGHEAPPERMRVVVRNPTLGVDVDLGGPSVASGAGLLLTAGNETAIEISPGQELYGIVASGTQEVSVLRTWD